MTNLASAQLQRAPHNPDSSGRVDRASATIDVRPLTGHIGAEIHGVDLRAGLEPETVAAIRAALLKWKVVFFRNQPLTHAEHVAFARKFGKPTVGHPVFGYVDGHPQIYSVARDRFKD